MRTTSLAVALSLLLTMTGLAVTPTKSKAPAKKAAPVKKAGTKPVSKSVSKKVVHSRAPATTWRNRQMSPTSDRYKEIQQALVEKGYLKSEPTGVWDNDSQDAMTRFQNDQKLPATGKITAASLIGLGLGAKSAGAPEASALPGAPTQPAAAP
jgi:peptidoglycan hydrolase-like protein with peptidoglycan-binding domain